MMEKPVCFSVCPSARMGVQAQGEGDHPFCRPGEKRGNPLRLRGAKPLDQSIVCEGVKAGAGRNDQMILQGYIQRLTCLFKAPREVNICLTWP